MAARNRMIFADIIILLIVALSVFVSVMRGFVKEALSLVIWMFAFWVAMNYSAVVDEKLMDTITSPSIRIMSAFAILFVPTLIIGALINKAFGQVVKKAGLSGTDRALGLVFGTARGVLIVAVIVLFAGMTSVPQESWWKESVLLVHFQEVAVWLQDVLPADMAAKNNFALSLSALN